MEASYFKKCHGCKKMSQWTQSANDICQFCQSPLSIIAKDKGNDSVFEAPIFSRWESTIITPEDGILMRVFKQLAFTGQIIFTSILSFFMWIIATLAG
jgi:predicted amidophosphoribosyltransferase